MIEDKAYEAEINEKNLKKAIEFLRENPNTIKRFIEVFGEDNVPADIKNLIPPNRKK